MSKDEMVESAIQNHKENSHHKLENDYWECSWWKQGRAKCLVKK